MSKTCLGKPCSIDPHKLLHNLTIILGGTCSSSQSNSARNRKRKSGSSSVKSAGNSPRKNSKNSSANLVPPNVGTSPQHVPILPATLDLPSEKEAPNQTAQQVALIRGAMGTTGRGAVSAKSVGSTQPVDRCAPSCSSGSGGMYEESELDVTQFTTDGGEVLFLKFISRRFSISIKTENRY